MKPAVSLVKISCYIISCCSCFLVFTLFYFDEKIPNRVLGLERVAANKLWN